MRLIQKRNVGNKRTICALVTNTANPLGYHRSLCLPYILCSLIDISQVFFCSVINYNIFNEWTRCEIFTLRNKNQQLVDCSSILEYLTGLFPKFSMAAGRGCPRPPRSAGAPASAECSQAAACGRCRALFC
jgi:hypothetical protein